MSPETKSGLDIVLNAINKKFGKGTAMILTEETMPDRDNAIPSGSLALDTALGIGGWPKGRVVEIYGPPSAGKSTVCLHAIAECQKQGGVAAFIDAEAALDVVYARSLDVDLEKLILIQPFAGEDALNAANMLARSGEVDLIIIDSVAALVPRKELEGDMEDQSIGVQARMMSKALRMLAGVLNTNECTLIFTNQTRMKIGVLYGNPEVTSGGNALPFYASVRAKINRTGDVGKKDDISGAETRVKIVKNKMAAPKKQAEFDIVFGKGINKQKDLLNEAVKDNLVVKSGSWYSYEGERLGQGFDTVVAFFQENPDKFEEVKQDLLEGRGLAIEGEKNDGPETSTETTTETEEEPETLHTESQD